MEPVALPRGALQVMLLRVPRGVPHVDCRALLIRLGLSLHQRACSSVSSAVEPTSWSQSRSRQTAELEQLYVQQAPAR